MKNKVWIRTMLATTFAAALVAAVEGSYVPATIEHLFEAVGNNNSSELGREVHGAGDQNGDGYADILAWARGESKMYLFYGGSPMDSLPDMVFDNALRGATADVNGDTTCDLLFSTFIDNRGYVRLYFGGTLLDTVPDLQFSSPDSGQGFGFPYAAGDVNGDGYEDIAISEIAIPDEQYQGKVRIYFGAVSMDSVADWVTVGDSLRHWFGVDIAGGDLNGDGCSDILVFGFRSTAPGGPGYIKVFYGSSSPDTVADLYLDGAQSQFPFTTHGRVVGDVNGEGYDDFCLSVGGFRDTAALVFFGGNPFDLVPDMVLKRIWQQGENTPGFVVTGPGDINRDGYADIMLGNRNAFSGFGEVRVYLGGPNMSDEMAFGFTGLGNPYDGAGIAVGKSGDVNGDGVDDIMFGAWNGDPGSNNYPGRVEIFSGDSTITGIVEPGNGILPLSFQLLQNYPNPFNSITTVRFHLPHRAEVALYIYNILGKEVKTLLQTHVEGGTHEVRWLGTTNEGGDAASGVYFYRLMTKTHEGILHTETKKMVLIR